MKEYEQHPLSTVFPGNEACNAGSLKPIASSPGEHTQINPSRFQCSPARLWLSELIRLSSSGNLKLRGDA